MPYNPQVIDRRGEALGWGIAGAGAALGGGIERYLEAKKERDKERKTALQFQKLLGKDDKMAKDMGYEDAIAAQSDSVDNFRYRAQAYAAKQHLQEAGLRNAAMAIELDPERLKDASASRKQQLEIGAQSLAGQKQELSSEEDLAHVFQAMGSNQQGPTATGEPPQFNDQLRAALAANPRAASARGFSPAINALMDAGRPGTSGLEALAPLLGQGGYRVSSIRVNPDGSPSPTLEPIPQQNQTAVPIMTNEGKETGKAMLGEKVIDLSPPNSEGKELSDMEINQLNSINTASRLIGELESRYKELGKDWGGPFSARATNALKLGQDPDISEIESKITDILPNYIKGINKEAGVLTDSDITRNFKIFPLPTDTQEVRERKLKNLRMRLSGERERTLDTLRKSGRDVTKFTDPTGTTRQAIIAEPKTIDEVKKLPKGTRFKWTDGKLHERQ